ncbi:hypothetical protein BLNAU_7238 [Blattamonas nauphoetae]|uniref:Uncharacterized protein n=1 Tax=Blattamonas nauphoetae TaxID=2049346 RepID=A0ABQ9Y2C3_9EUKA|nr:hypothetical protein BLNAU_7238 [Blattamonas nauphoetae]
MENDIETLTTTSETYLNSLPNIHSTVEPLQESFLNFDVNSKSSFEDKSTIYCSLVTLVNADYPFDNILQDRAARFSKNLEPRFGDHDHAAKLVTDLVPSSTGPSSGFVASIVTLLSSPHSTVVAAALSFLSKTNRVLSKLPLRLHLVESDIVTKVLATVQPHTLTICGNKAIFDNLNNVIANCLYLASPSSLGELGKIAAVDSFNHREMIFQKVVLPSSQFVTFLISNRRTLSGDLLHSFMSLLGAFLGICPYHHPTLEFVLASPIAMAFSSCLTHVEDKHCLWVTHFNINFSLNLWTTEGPEVAQSAKRMMQALISECSEDTLEQTLRNEKRGIYGIHVDNICLSLSKLLGLNVEFTEW